MIGQQLNLITNRIQTSMRIWSYLMDSKNQKESIGYNKWFFYNLSLPWQLMNDYYWDNQGQAWGKSLFEAYLVKFLEELSTNAKTTA